MKPSIPKGTRDFSPQQILNRNFIFDTIKSVFTKFGFQPIETPTMENLATLTGKYGDEGDQLLFKILNSGNYLSKIKEDDYQNKDYKKLTFQLAEKGLRYDLTVPFARYVVMYQNDIVFPFKRYQIQPVWRADKPQKGRYREFYQCDVDVVGSDSLLYEAELVQIYDEVFAKLNLQTIIKINNRKILAGMAEAAGIADKFMEMTIAIDKLDKIGWDGVQREMTERDIAIEAVHRIGEMLKAASLQELKPFLASSQAGAKGVEELETVFDFLSLTELKNSVQFDVTLARGLNYYTGCIFEVAIDEAAYPDLKMGSIGGGGRYDDLTAMFGLSGVSGVGVSFGAERIYDVMEGLNLFPNQENANLKLLLIGLDEPSHRFAFELLQEVRKAGINAEIYPEPAHSNNKLKKQMKYANARNVAFVGVVGEEELKQRAVALKNMTTGEQGTQDIEAVIATIQKA